MPTRGRLPFHRCHHPMERATGRRVGQEGGWPGPQQAQTSGGILPRNQAVPPTYRNQPAPSLTKGGGGSLPLEPQPLFPWQPLFQDKAETQNYPQPPPGSRRRRQREGPGRRAQRGN